MNIEISESNRSDKKLKAVIDGTNCTLWRCGLFRLHKHKDPDRTYLYQPA